MRLYEEALEEEKVLSNLSMGFLGTGVMAEAMIKGLTDKGLVKPERIIGSDPVPQRREEVESRYHICMSADNREAVEGRDVVVLSIKPQVLREVLSDIRGLVPRQALILSIVAGARISTIGRLAQHRAIVRVMPNTPAQIGQGMSVWTATAEVSPAQREQAQAILRALGEELFVAHEDYLDMATALSGTGPAYVFLFMEALIDAGVHMGFSRQVAQQLVLQTMQGSVAFARQSARHPAELRNMVTSPGGTSAEALYQLEKGALRTIVSRAVWAAYQKSKYLGDLSEKAEE